MLDRPQADQYLVVTSSHGRPPVWTWEIQRRPKGLGIKVFGTDFKTESTKPLLRGADAATNTIGMERVSRSNAWVAGVPSDKIVLGARLTNSATAARTRSCPMMLQRWSMRTVPPSDQPSLSSASRKAA
jgi:hypothetical protein